MDENEAGRKIAALKAIIQTLLLERYWKEDEDEGKRGFLRVVASDDPVSMAIVTELTEHELDVAFRWPEQVCMVAGNELLATPVVAFLNEEQYERARITRVAADERDRVLVLALEELDLRGAEARGTEACIRLAEQRFVAAMVKDLVARRGEPLDSSTKGTVDEKIDAMPEPWKNRTQEELSELREEIRKVAEDGLRAS